VSFIYREMASTHCRVQIVGNQNYTSDLWTRHSFYCTLV